MDDLDEVDRACAIAAGMRVVHDAPHLWENAHGVFPRLCPEARLEFSPSRVPADHIALLLWHAREGRVARVAVDASGASADLDDPKERPLASALAPCPMVALARATAKWAEGRGK